MLGEYPTELPFAQAGGVSQRIYPDLLALLDLLKHLDQRFEMGEMCGQCQLPLQERLDECHALRCALCFEHTTFERFEIGLFQAVEIDIAVREELARHLCEQMERIGVKENQDHL